MGWGGAQLEGVFEKRDLAPVLLDLHQAFVLSPWIPATLSVDSAVQRAAKED